MFTQNVRSKQAPDLVTVNYNEHSCDQMFTYTHGDEWD